jgi:hypothetical protein
LYYAHGQKPPCAKCFPEIHPYNLGVLDLYNIVGDQYIMSQSGPISINTLAIGDAFDRYYESVDNQRYFIDRLKILVNSYLQSQQESTEKKYGKKNGNS